MAIEFAAKNFSVQTTKAVNNVDSSTARLFVVAREFRSFISHRCGKTNSVSLYQRVSLSLDVVSQYQRATSNIFRNYSTQSYTVDNLENILDNPKFDRNKQTAIYSYGFTQTVYQPSVRGIVEAYLENGDFNFVLVNYNSIFAYNVLVRRRHSLLKLQHCLVFLVER